MKTTMRYHFSLVKIQLSKQKISAGQDVEKRELSYTVGGEVIC